MKHKLVTLLVFLTILVLSSCVTKKKLTYLQYSDRDSKYDLSAGDPRLAFTPASYKIMPYDNLYIRVITPDPQWSELFNSMPVGAGGAVTEESASLVGYPVDEDGKIEIPFIGKVDVAGKTLSQIKVELDTVYQNYITDAAITVRLVSNYISIIGEVGAPGRYRLSKERLNVFEAISMAGDLVEFSNRQEVQLIRPSPFGPIIKEFSLLDRNILNSEFYYVMPNDIIYVKPMSGKMFGYNTSIYTLFVSTLTTALVIISYFRTL